MNLNMRHYKPSMGLGDTASGTTQTSACASTYNIFSSQFWDCLGANLQGQIAGVYGQAQYGSIPAPVAIQPPGTVAIDSSGLITATTADQIAQQQAQGSIDATIAAQNAAIAAGITSGAYTPSGNLPVTATDLSNYAQNPLGPTNMGTTILIVALGIGVIFLLEGKKR